MGKRRWIFVDPRGMEHGRNSVTAKEPVRSRGGFGRGRDTRNLFWCTLEPVQTNPRNNVVSLPFFFFPPLPPFPTQPSLPSNRSSREKQFHPSFRALLSRIRWTLFSRARKIPRRKKGERAANRIASHLPPFPSTKWNIQRLFVRAGIPVIRSGTKFTRWTVVFAVVERVWKGRMNLYLPWSRGKDGERGDRNFPERCVRTHSPRPSCPRSSSPSSYKYDVYMRAPPPFRLDKVCAKSKLLISVSSMCADKLVWKIERSCAVFDNNRTRDFPHLVGQIFFDIFFLSSGKKSEGEVAKQHLPSASSFFLSNPLISHSPTNLIFSSFPLFFSSSSEPLLNPRHFFRFHRLINV